jgi:hypothetical protein
MKTDAVKSFGPEERYRLYVDESGDHVIREFTIPGHRYLCLLGCWFSGRSYAAFHQSLEEFKQRHVPHSPDEPVILHREDIANRRGSFWRLRDPGAAERFDADLVELIASADLLMTAVVIDKQSLQERYAVPAHPYNLAMGFLLQRYCGYLNHFNRRGDVMAESRGGVEDRKLKESYGWVYERGVWMREASFFQQALTSRQLKVKPKSANIAGLQLADLLAHPVRKKVLVENHCISEDLAPFAAKLLSAVESKFNRHLYEGRTEGYGTVLFPKAK